jgi:hypothetical protein
VFNTSTLFNAFDDLHRFLARTEAMRLGVGVCAK